MRKILLIGATSAIAEATARRFAQRGDRLYLVGRNADRLSAIEADLRVRGANQAISETLDINNLDEHPALLDRAETALGGLDTVLITYGTLSDQVACQQSVELTLRELHTNASSVISLLTLLGNRFEVKKQGTLVAISSVAGDRGRASNYVYGTAKAAVTTFTSGLRQRLAPVGVKVITVKPGFVDTPMTRDFPKGALWAEPDDIAQGIVKAIDRGRPVVYLPWFWRWIMGVIKHLPERVFLRVRI